jgi:hypothetical protein
MELTVGVYKSFAMELRVFPLTRKVNRVNGLQNVKACT